MLEGEGKRKQDRLSRQMMIEPVVVVNKSLVNLIYIISQSKR